VCQKSDRITPADLSTAVAGRAASEIEAATGQLENYGYLKRVDWIRMRFRFYTMFIVSDPGPAMTDSRKIERLMPKVFISRSREHPEWLDRLLNQLKPLLRERFQDWLFIGRNLMAGDRWNPEIQKALDASDMAIAIVTPGFLNSEYITEQEIPKILCKAEDGRFKLLSLFAERTPVDEVICRVGDKDVHLTDYLGLNDYRTPLSSLSPDDWNAELVRISKEIVRRMHEVRKRTAAE
jgi:hypothetical protein